MNKGLETKVKAFAKAVRETQIEMFRDLGFGHVGGSLSATDLFAVLYEGIMKYDPTDPTWDKRDRLVVSKGHSGPALYSTLALKGFFPKAWLSTLNRGGTNLPSHCDRNKTPGVDMTTGSLGQGASTALGMAMALKKTGQNVFLLLGDGECDEGQVWEMALSAAHHKVGNLIAFVDYNHKQLDGTTEEILDLGDLGAKFEAFGWYTQVVNGHDVAQLYEAIEQAQKKDDDRPSMIVMETIKGKGVSFVEDTEYNHHITLSDEQAAQAMEEINQGCQ